MTVIEICDAIERLLEAEGDRAQDAAEELGRSEGYDEGYFDAKEEWRLKGFEEGYDEAEKTFDPEGGYEDVKIQAYDRGFRSGQDDGFMAGRKVGRAECVNKLHGARLRRGSHGC